MTILVVGASGSTGRQLVMHLLNRGQNVKVIVRSPNKLPDTIKDHEHLSVITASVLELNDAELEKIVNGCDAVASCLGHNMNWQGMYGHPRKLVTDTARRMCHAIKANGSVDTVKYVLMNSAGNSNRDLNEPTSFGHRMVISLLRLLVPPHVDNEAASDYLRTEIGHNDGRIEWAAVRPINLVDEEKVSEYEAHASPIKGAIFDKSKIGRINVAHFMADLITDDHIWSMWKRQMPVIYNSPVN